MGKTQVTFTADEEAAAPIYGLLDIMRDLGAIDYISRMPITDVPESKPVYGTCDTCGLMYESLFGDKNQCSKMCARVTEDGRIVGGYGSEEIDLEVWKLPWGFSSVPHVKPGNICDHCIRYLKLLNHIVCVEENYLG